jgi:hypothetical protein
MVNSVSTHLQKRCVVSRAACRRYCFEGPWPHLGLRPLALRGWLLSLRHSNFLFAPLLVA